MPTATATATASASAAPKTTRHSLRNAHGWQLTYVVGGRWVKLVRRYRGADVGSEVMTRREARRHWRAQRATGFETAAGSL